jgi:uncharacterized protein (DUF1800 family)
MAGTDSDLKAAIAVTRFGLGARPGEIAAVRSDPQGWLKSQIRRSGAEQPSAPAGALKTMSVSFATYQDVKQEIKGAEKPKRREMLSQFADDLEAEMLARARLGAATQAGFRERWALFWSNHFTVAAKRRLMGLTVGPFEREAIRPNVFGRFEDLLMASSRHPAMLLYLDQAESIGPDSPAAKRRNKGGLNENLAREIMELHTVGADAGYTQADVTEFARALTGWSAGGPHAPDTERGVYLYKADYHQPGPRTIMGRRYDGSGEDQARKVLSDLAGDPRTARRLSHKIAMHFVADDPPPALVERLTQAWSQSRGDLATVAAALIASPAAWDPAPLKLKTPWEFVVSAYRAVDAAPSDGQREVNVPLRIMGQRPFSAPQPNGWSDQGADWAAADAIVKRLEWAADFSTRFASRASPLTVADAALGPRLGQASRQAIQRAASPQDGLTILLMSPEFQRR